MIRVLENNTLGQVLASIGAVLLLICLGLVVMWAIPPSAGSGADDDAEADVSSKVTTLQSARPLEEYVVISERPVFNEDRRPAPELDLASDTDDLPVDEDIGAPDVELAGVIITPSLKMATLKSKEHQYSLVAFEGEPLEGDFGSWQVSRIEERMVTLASADGEEMQLELQVHDAVIKEPPKSAKEESPEDVEQRVADRAEALVPESDEAMTRAEEIRQRIEERREELRRAAEERDDSQAENYRDAIQSMIQQRQNLRGPQQEEQEADEDGQ